MIEGEQRDFTSKISAVSHLYYWEWPTRPKLMSLQQRMELFIIILMFKCHVDKVPNHLGIEFHSSGRLGIQAALPSLSRGCGGRVQAQYEESVAAIGPRLRNVLPVEISVMDDPQTFK